jgi:hypothetical protein
MLTISMTTESPIRISIDFSMMAPLQSRRCSGLTKMDSSSVSRGKKAKMRKSGCCYFVQAG